jgi:hypothetical protein
MNYRVSFKHWDRVCVRHLQHGCLFIFILYVVHCMYRPCDCLTPPPRTEIILYEISTFLINSV